MTVPPLTARLADGWRRGLDHATLALVPLVTALLATRKVEQVATFQGRHLGLRLGLPAGVVDVWQFVSVPNETVGIGLPWPGTPALLLVTLPVAVAVQAALAAGYFGSLSRALETGRFDFAANVRRHFWPFLAYTVIPLVVLGPVVLLGLAGPRPPAAALVVLFPAFIAAGYLFFATPYLVVLRGAGLVSALRASYRLAVAGGPYLRYATGYAGFVLGVSIVATAVVVNLGLFGVAVGAVAAAPLGLACNAATMRFVADIDPASPSLGEWSEPPAEGTHVG